jgi:4-hydroxy-tetrahydrodipicolinate reductase
MGQRLIALAADDADLVVCGAVEHAESPFLGQDAGMLAIGDELGVAISADLAASVAGADAVIDFSAPSQAVHVAESAIAAGAGYVLGTTGLTSEQYDGLRALSRRGRLVVASNMSVGVNLLFQLAGQVARTLGIDYDIEIIEMHHNQKKDAPSGTAVRLGEVVAEARGLNYETDTEHGRVGMVGAREEGKIGMHALRGGDVVGDHTVMFATAGERIELTHRASTRDTFAVGALRAAKFLRDAEPGQYDMAAVLGLTTA